MLSEAKILHDCTKLSYMATHLHQPSLNLEAAAFFETTVVIYQTTRRHIQKDSNSCS
jgi:hypothetical protein